MDEIVLHDRDHYRFYLELDDEEAYIQYNILPSGELNFYKTYVPESHRGKRYAEKLMKAGLDYARRQELKIKPSCSYVVNYFEKNPQDSFLRV
ncbi:MAG: N-acetyltransferase [Spirochaetales bacterium]|nr:N-acetyltransferase [Spirochaetales bacterium]